MHPSSTPTYEPTTVNEARCRSVEPVAVVVVGLDDVLTADDEDEGLVDDGDLGDYIIETTRDYSGEAAAAATGQEPSANEIELGEEILDDIEEMPVRDVDGAEASPAEPYVYNQRQRVQDM